jgi:E3 ubiquitin-protein ligase MYCBP2
MFLGKSAALGHKQPCPAGQWNEMAITKSPKIVQFSVGHEGQHALLLSEDGSVYFVGTARRGEDGDQTKATRRQPKPVKPKKLARLDGYIVSHVRHGLFS